MIFTKMHEIADANTHSLKFNVKETNKTKIKMNKILLI